MSVLRCLKIILVGQQPCWRHAIRFSASSVILVASFCVVGCDIRSQTIAEAFGVPAPAPKLLAKQPQPKCKTSNPSRITRHDSWTPYNPSPSNSGKKADSVTQAPSAAPASADGTAIIKQLVRERDCFRQAEVQARQKLHQLQASIGHTLTILQEPKAGQRANSKSTE